MLNQERILPSLPDDQRQAVLDKLPEHLFEAVILSKQQNCSNEEIALIQGITEKEAQFRVEQARELVKDLIEYLEMSPDDYSDIGDDDCLIESTSTTLQERLKASIVKYAAPPSVWYVDALGSPVVGESLHDAETLLWGWINEPQHLGILVLGESGVGKTALLRKILWSFVAQPTTEDGPLLIPCLNLTTEWMSESDIGVPARTLANRRIVQLLGDLPFDDPLGKLMDQHRVCFVFDGFNPSLMPRQREHIRHLTDSLIELYNLGVTVIVASLEAQFEPNFASGRSIGRFRKQVGPDRLKRIRLSGLLPAQREAVVQRFLKAHPTSHQKSIDAFKSWLSNPKAGEEIGRIPYWLEIALRVAVSGGFHMESRDLHDEPYTYLLRRLLETEAQNETSKLRWNDVEALTWSLFVDEERGLHKVIQGISPQSHWFIPTFLGSPAREKVLANFIGQQIIHGRISDLSVAPRIPVTWQIAKQILHSLAVDKVNILIEKMLAQSGRVNIESIELIIWHIAAVQAMYSKENYSKRVIDYCTQRFEHHLSNLGAANLDEEKFLISIAVARETSIILDLANRSEPRSFVQRYVTEVQQKPKSRAALAAAVVEYYGTVPIAFTRIIAHLKNPERYGVMIPIELLEIAAITEKYHRGTDQFGRRLKAVCHDFLSVIDHVRSLNGGDPTIQNLTYESMKVLASAFYAESASQPTIVALPSASQSDQNSCRKHDPKNRMSIDRSS